MIDLSASPAKWITCDRMRPIHGYAMFVREFTVDDACRDPAIWITADSRYRLWLDDAYLGDGPARTWPALRSVDHYRLAEHLTPGPHRLTIILNRIGIDTTQYVDQPSGLWVHLAVTSDRNAQAIVSDTQWRTCPVQHYAYPVPRIAPGLGWEEQYDARDSEVAASWSAAVLSVLQHDPPRIHARISPPPSQHIIRPARLHSVHRVRPWARRWSIINTADYDRLAARFRVDQSTLVQLEAPHGLSPWRSVDWQLNGEPILDDPQAAHGLRSWGGRQVHRITLGPGTHQILGLPRQRPLPRLVLNFDADAPLQWLDMRNQPTSADRPWQGLPRDAEDEPEHWRALPDADYAREDVFAVCHSDISCDATASDRDVLEALVQYPQQWVTLPPCDGDHLRLRFDFARVHLGLWRFEIDAPAGTIVDMLGFEHMTPHGEAMLPNGMNNTMRYTTGQGPQAYLAWTRRGFRYLDLIVRARPGDVVRLRQVGAVDQTANPQVRAKFQTADTQLQRIWDVSVDTLAPCREDTFTDCPTQEQALWLGDARISAVNDLILTGDARLSRYSLELGAQSMHAMGRPWVLSHVPHVRANVIPAWSFMWMRWCWEHVLWTGDRDAAQSLMPALQQQVTSMAEHMDQDDLLRIPGWNFFDWAPLDGPQGAATGWNQALAVWGLQATAALAHWMDEATFANHCDALARRLRDAMNRHLWDARAQCMIDSIHADGRRSTSISQHTQAMALLSGVVDAERARQCLDAMQQPSTLAPQSPFAASMILEALAQIGQPQHILPTLGRLWGRQLDQGAASFWEMDHADAPRPTRSFCHAWSSSPVHLITRFIAGLEPMAPGCERMRIAPRPDLLDVLYLCIATPRGPLAVHWHRHDRGWHLHIEPAMGGVCDIAWPPHLKAANLPLQIDQPVEAEVLENL